MEPLGASWGDLGAELGGLGATLGALDYYLCFFDGFWGQKGCPKGGIWGAKMKPKSFPKRVTIDVDFQKRKKLFKTILGAS